MASFKDLASRVSDVSNKDANNISNQANSFSEASEGWLNNLTGETVKDKKTSTKIASNKEPGEAGQISTAGITNTDIVEPQEASFKPLYAEKADSESYETEKPGKANQTIKIPGSKDVPFSKFNQWSLHNYKGGPFEDLKAEDYNGPLYTGPNLDFRDPTASRIIQVINEHNNPAYTYNFSDFALAKYYGKISNNYMVTLRRFPTPVEDNIVNPNVLSPSGDVIKKAMPDLARAVTWMSDVTDNKLEDILKFSVETAWKEVESQVQEISSSGGKGGALGSKIGSSGLLSSIYGAAQGMNASQVHSAKNGFDATKGTYPNHVFGPINVIKKIMVRDAGLNFSQGFDLKFHYSLRQLDGVSPKIAFLDMMSNILVLTYNNANFWGGSSRYTGGGGAFNKPFGDHSKLKSGDFGGFLGSLFGDATKGIGNILGDIKENGLTGSKLGQNILGGSLMKMFGTPQAGEAINAFLTGDPTGQYHVTIGNPMMPIATIGNLICEGADYQFGGELSYEGFPTELTVTVKLKPGRPRDKADIERMFNGGKERMYLTPSGGVDTNLNTNNTAYGNADSPQQADIYRKMTNG